ncbi:GNAT family N-acetyltransferase [Candidatus Soleaferrea massiliensis]|uniref:GNAT family N-acetyltransferase n=1 Tax=Candidatus Soleaferrea massiliensis TaxID=1470354 RepID=UPI00058BA434|nr:GNAT family N-acetyltransferase [Candidatus Soleaferrea massiliensis]
MEFIVEENRIYCEQDGKLLAEVTFPQRTDGTVEINHTFVDDALRGQGIAGQLMQGAADSIRRSGRKAVPTCSYAVKWFEKHPDDADILA